MQQASSPQGVETGRGSSLVGEGVDERLGSLNSDSPSPLPTVYVAINLNWEAIEEAEAARVFPVHYPMGVPAANAASDTVPWRALSEEQKDERFYRHRPKHWCAICRERIPRCHYPGVGFRHTSSAIQPCTCHLCFDCADLWDHPKCPRCASDHMAYGIFWLLWPDGVARMMPQPSGTHSQVADGLRRFRFVWPPPRGTRWSPWQHVSCPDDM